MLYIAIAYPSFWVAAYEAMSCSAERAANATVLSVQGAHRTWSVPVYNRTHRHAHVALGAKLLVAVIIEVIIPASLLQVGTIRGEHRVVKACNLMEWASHQIGIENVEIARLRSKAHNPSEFKFKGGLVRDAVRTSWTQ